MELYPAGTLVRSIAGSYVAGTVVRNDDDGLTMITVTEATDHAVGAKVTLGSRFLTRY